MVTVLDRMVFLRLGPGPVALQCCFCAFSWVDPERVTIVKPFVCGADRCWDKEGGQPCAVWGMCGGCAVGLRLRLSWGPWCSIAVSKPRGSSKGWDVQVLVSSMDSSVVSEFWGSSDMSPWSQLVAYSGSGPYKRRRVWGAISWRRCEGVRVRRPLRGASRDRVFMGGWSEGVSWLV